MLRVLLAAGVGVLLFVALFAPSQTQTSSQLFAPATAALPRQPQYREVQRAATLPQYGGAQRPVPFARAGAPRMVDGIAESAASLATLDMPSAVLLAKSQSDELLDDFFASFPILFVGLIFGYAALNVAKSVLEVEPPEGTEGIAIAAACLGGAAFFFLLSNSGAITGTAGIVAKTALDAWNLFASNFLKGALLNYSAR